MDKIICSKCGAQYELSYTRLPVRDKDSINCMICNEEIHSWNEAKTWKAKLIKINETK